MPGINPANNQPFSGDNRGAYLPDSPEGREILALFTICFKRRLTLSIGRSITRNVDNVVIWNGVHHKSRTNRGAAHFGYPDATYYNRVKQELTLKGVTWPSEEQKWETIDEVT